MKKVCLGILAFFLFISGVYGVTCSANPSTTTIELDGTKVITISCTFGSGDEGTTVDVSGTYIQTCLDDTSGSYPSTATLNSGSTSSSFTFRAISMACQENVDDRKITWKFTPTSGTIADKYTIVTITSPLSITATFSNTTYTATPGSSVTIALEVSTTASEDINNINIDMSNSNPSLGLGDKSISKIAASEGEKTQQVSWTINAPSTEGTYGIQARVTSQNADSDTATASLVVSSAEEGGTTGVTTTTTRGGGGGGTPAAITATKKMRLVPGIGLKNNFKLQNALERVLGKKKLNQNAINNLVRLSKSITSKVEITKNFRTYQGKSQLNLTLKYKGNKTVKNFIIYDNVPKSFANSSDKITVSAPKSNWKVVESDPSYVFVYPELKKDEEVKITYAVEGTVLSSVINETSTEVYAESLEIPTEEGVPSKECNSGNLKCVGNDLYGCINGTWDFKESCEFGCESGGCKEKPKAGKEVKNKVLWEVLAAVLLVIFLLLLFFFLTYTPKKTKNSKK